MITVEEALKIVRDNTRDFGIEQIPLNHALGRILREPIIADRDMPPYDRVTMDGIAINYENYKTGQREFKVDGVAAAGAPKINHPNQDSCLEVMTGAIMPDGLDTVIPYELINITNEVAIIQAETVNCQQNIHFKGSDRKRGTEIISPGKKLSSVEIGVCSTVGKAKVKVSKLPKAIIISTGDELVEIEDNPLPHQIRMSNVYRMKTVLKSYNIPCQIAHLNDDYDEIIKKLGTILDEYEVILLSGGVSKGKFDFLPKALEELGVNKHFHKIKQRPGKPFWFGTAPDNTTVFAFPGNPVSSFMCMQQYFKDWLEESLQSEKLPTPMAKLGSDVTFKPDLTYYLEVKLDYSEKGELVANPVKGNGSGDLVNLVDADAFIVLPLGRNEYHKDEVYPIINYR